MREGLVSNKEAIMPGIDFDVLRAEIIMQQVLDKIGFTPTHRNGDQLHRPCPGRGSTSTNSHVFSVNLGARRYLCHQCEPHGNQLEFDASVQGSTVHQPAVDSCRALARDVPWTHDGETANRKPNREEAPVLELPKNVACSKTNPRP